MVPGMPTISLSGKPLTFAQLRLIGTGDATAMALRRAARATRILSIIGLFSSAASGASRESWRSTSGMAESAEAEVANWLSRESSQMNWRDDTRPQDPPSLRMLPQIFGAAMGQLRRTAEVVLEATCQRDDNPVILKGEALKSGGSPPLELSISLQTCQLVLAHLARNIFNRCNILMNGGRRGLPANLVRQGTASAGFGSELKLLGDLCTRVLALSSPLFPLPLADAHDVEEEAAYWPQSIERLEEQTDALLHMAALEALFAAQASDILVHDHGGAGTAVHELVRRHSDFYDFDRPLFEEIETLKDALSQEQHSDTLLQRYPLRAFDDIFDLAAGAQANIFDPVPARDGAKDAVIYEATASLREDTDVGTLLSWNTMGLVH